MKIKRLPIPVYRRTVVETINQLVDWVNDQEESKRRISQGLKRFIPPDPPYPPVGFMNCKCVSVPISEEIKIEKENTMKQTKIKYQKMDDGLIRIIRFENVGNEKDLLKMLGFSLFKEYMNPNSLNYFLNKNNAISITKPYPNGARTTRNILAGSKHSPETFNWIIKTMKEAGKRLTELRKEREKQKEQEIKEIII